MSECLEMYTLISLAQLVHASVAKPYQGFYQKLTALLIQVAPVDARKFCVHSHLV